MRPRSLPRFTRAQRGQAATEMVVATAFLLPLFLSIVYVARYIDIKQTTVQASRYVAFERAIDPSSKRKDSDLANEVRTRFFASGNRFNGNINSVAFVAGTPGTDEDNSFWSDQSGKRLLNSFTDVNVFTANRPAPGKISGIVSKSTAALFGLNTKGFVIGNVEATLQNVDGFDPLAAIDMRIGATTAILGDTWGANGAGQVRTRIRKTVPASYLGSALNTFAWFLTPFESAFSSYDFGCINPDVVPKDRLQPYQANGYCSD
ncbi:TadE family protein [Ralstonia pseudosolanacearum]|uniref:Pilus assembly protein n=1 Tax=Ralstonia solanacearum TaxID=305 RepID=A0AA92K4G6_RALSL|nr:TadE family protein [Ralstonia pseudosolanacearum]QOK93227.1 pilus assembly protein [Ralstonia pseudosolanacearum]QOK98124.1 pilus assembly protein [Ralstonia pseudosolanacearum]UWD90932.1 pilus assembly protein [Ralstonia pseudosolanacearum]CAH0441190.1 hypothetical protein LMG9673_01988 [Ralstonia pseudosolanacearum]